VLRTLSHGQCAWHPCAGCGHCLHHTTPLPPGHDPVTVRLQSHAGGARSLPRLWLGRPPRRRPAPGPRRAHRPVPTRHRPAYTQPARAPGLSANPHIPAAHRSRERHPSPTGRFITMFNALHKINTLNFLRLPSEILYVPCSIAVLHRGVGALMTARVTVSCDCPLWSAPARRITTMPTVTDAPVPAYALINQDDPLAILPTTPTTPLHTPRRRVPGLWRLLRTVLGACTRCHPQETPRLNPDYPPQETAVDHVIRLDPSLYLRTLSG
jgi:hypothetical protein